MNCFMTGDPDKKYGTNKPPPAGRVRERSKRDTELEVFLSSKGWIQTIANQSREEIQKQRGNNQMVVQP